MDYQYHEFYEYDDYSNDENRGSIRKVPGEKIDDLEHLQMAIVLLQY